MPHYSVNVEHRLSSTLHGHQIEAIYRLYRHIWMTLVNNTIQRVDLAPRTPTTNSQGDFTENEEDIPRYVYNHPISHFFNYISSKALNLSLVFEALFIARNMTSGTLEEAEPGTRHGMHTPTS